MRAAHGEKWLDEAASAFRDRSLPHDGKSAMSWDTHAMLSIIARSWLSVFGKRLGRTERSLVEELRDTRNEWAHQKQFSTDDTYRALDSVQRLLSAISAEQAVEVERSKQEVLRVRFGEQPLAEARGKHSPLGVKSEDVRERTATNYWVYENRPTNRSTMHLSICSYCNEGRGVRPSSSQRNGKWHGPFQSFEAANQTAAGLARPLRRCSHCAP